MNFWHFRRPNPNPKPCLIIYGSLFRPALLLDSVYFDLMPKVKTVPTLYNHDDRPYAVTSWTTDGLNGQGSLDSHHIQLPPPAIPAYDNADYAMPFDEPAYQHCDPAPEGNMLSGGLPGIQVIPKLRAKRYMNSVGF